MDSAHFTLMIIAAVYTQMGLRRWIERRSGAVTKNEMVTLSLVMVWVMQAHAALVKYSIIPNWYQSAEPNTFSDITGTLAALALGGVLMLIAWGLVRAGRWVVTRRKAADA